MKKLLLITTLLFPSAVMAGGMPRSDAKNGWDFFGINIPYHNGFCWELSDELVYGDLCEPKNSKAVQVNADKPLPPKEDKPVVDVDNGGDTKEGNDDSNGGDSSDDSNGSKSKDKSRDYNGGSSDGNSDDNGGDSD